MTTRLICSILITLVLTAGSVHGGLVHHWPFDADATDTVGGLNGTVQGPAVVPGRVDGALQFDGTNDAVEFANFVPPVQGTIVLWLNAANVVTRGRFLGSVDQYEAYVENGLISNQLFSAGSLPGYINSTTKLEANTWYHLALTYDGTSHLQQIYVNGELDAEGMTADDPWGGGRFSFGHRADQTSQFYNGILDDVRYFDTVLDAAAVRTLMKGNAQQAVAPSPADASLDVPRDTILSWTPAEVAVAHDVYFSPSREDAGNAERTNPLGALAGQGRSDTAYEPTGLEYGRTYYWRVDEVDAAPESAIFKGRVWSFTVEPYAYPIRNVMATASSAEEDMGPENTVNGSGLDAHDQHSTDVKQMWLSSGTLPNWIQYEFDAVYKLHELWVWNSNQTIESIVGFGARSVRIEYSLDGATWTAWAGVPEFARGTGKPTYVHDTTVPFGGVSAKYVKLTIDSSWGGTAATCLSEVRFFYVPVQAGEPVPADAAADIDLDAVLSWRSGREAASHAVYFGTDMDAVAGGTAPVATVADNVFNPAALELGTTYYWRVDEVNEAEVPSTCQGSVWSFDTREYVVVDDFESYTDEEGSRIYETWIDGYNSDENGSQVGYIEAPFAERGIVNSGRQSMPLLYDNTGAAKYSETERSFDEWRDWTQAGITTLVIHFHGDPNNTGGRLYLKINGVKIPYSGDAAAITSKSWTRWDVDLTSVGTNLKKVTGLIIGVDGGGLGVLYVDDIRLFPGVPPMAPVMTVGPAEAVEATGDDGKVLSIDGMDVSGLVLATTAADFEKYADHPAAHADDFDLATYASLDEAKTITVRFAVPVTTIFIIERGGNDQGLFQALDAKGKPLGSPQAFEKGHWLMAGAKVNGQDAGAIVIQSTLPIHGILLLPPAGGVTGIDPACISGVPAQ